MSNIAKIGPWGGTGGTERDVQPNPTPTRLLNMTIRHGDCIDAISFDYTASGGRTYSVGPWGGNGGKEEKFTIGPLNFVKEISGTWGQVGGNDVVTSLTIGFQTGEPRTYGNVNGTPFRIPVLNGGRIVGFFGRSGIFLDAIGVYINP